LIEGKTIAGPGAGDKGVARQQRDPPQRTTGSGEDGGEVSKRIDSLFLRSWEEFKRGVKKARLQFKGWIFFFHPLGTTIEAAKGEKEPERTPNNNPLGGKKKKWNVRHSKRRLCAEDGAEVRRGTWTERVWARRENVKQTPSKKKGSKGTGRF